MFSTFKNASIKTKILISLTGLSILSIASIGWLGYSNGHDAIEESQFRQLTSIREMRAKQIEKYFKTIENQIITLSNSTMIVDAMKQFKGSFKSYTRDVATESLKAYYKNEFIQRLDKQTGASNSISEYFPNRNVTRYLQSLYISENTNSTGEKHHLDYASV